MITFEAVLRHDKGVCWWVLTTKDAKMDFPRAGQGYSHKYRRDGSLIIQISNAKRGLKRFAKRTGIKVKIKEATS